VSAVEKRRSQRSLGDAQAGLGDLLAAAPVALYTAEMGGDSAATFVSENFGDKLGYPAASFLERPDFWISHVHPDDRGRILGELPAAIERGEHSHEYRFLHADGSYRWMHDEFRVVRDGTGRREIVGFWVDVTQRRRAEEILDAFLEASPMAVAIVGSDLRYVRVNPEAARLNGLPPEAHVGRPIREVLGEAAAAVLEPTVREVFATGRAILGVEMSARAPGASSPSHHWGSLFPIGGPDTGPDYVGVVFSDTTAQERAQEALRESEERLHGIFDQAAVGIAGCDIEGRFQSVNARFCEIVGYGEEDLRAMTLREIIHPQDLDEDLETFERPTAGRRSGLSREKRCTRGDGQIIWVELTLSPVHGGDGRARGVVGIVQDITERRRVEAEARASRRRLQEVLGATPALLWTIDGDGVLTTLEGRSIEKVNADPGRFLGWSIFDVFADVPELLTHARRALAGEAFSAVVEMDGRIYDSRYTPVRNGAGEVVGVSGLAMDATERYGSETALRRMHRHLSHAQRVGHIGSWEWDIPRGGLWWSDEVHRIFGVEPQDFAPTYEAFLVMVHPEDRVLVTDGVGAALRKEKEYSVEHRVVRPDGGLRWVQERGEVRFDGSGAPVTMLGTVLDVTDRREAEAALRESEERFRQIAENVGSVFWVATPGDARVLYLSPGFERVWGRPVAEVIADPGLWLETVHPDDRGEVERMIRTDPMEHQQVYRIVRPDGSLRWVHVRVSPVSDAGGAVRRVVGVADDVTEREVAERSLREASEQLRRSLEDKNVLLREIHHRVKNNMQVVSSLLYLQSARVSDPGARRWLAESRDRVASMALVHEMLYASPGLARIDFGDYLGRLVHGLAGSWGPGGRVELRQRVDDVALDVDTAVPLGLLINELVTNALKHASPGEHGGKVRVGLERGEPGELVLTVEDDGAGLPDAVDVENPATLGLSLVRTLVDQLDGRLNVRRRPGAGFTVRFPSKQEATD
jgi:PAS domain S-box-containing protein